MLDKKQLKIGILGTGKLGTNLAEYIKNNTNHKIAGIYSQRNIAGTTNSIMELQKNCDILIDCTINGFDQRAKDIKLPLIIATTQEKTIMPNAPLLELPLSTLSWNLATNLLIKLAKTEKYSFSICDIHHKHKKDQPSGASRQLIKALENFNSNVECHSYRIGEITGIHSILAISEYDMIKIEHQAFSRQSFSQSLVHAAQWLITKELEGPKIYKAQDWINCI
jgi:4-hydroxy-tetrahydrodipicolinate reductase